MSPLLKIEKLLYKASCDHKNPSHILIPNRKFQTLMKEIQQSQFAGSNLGTRTVEESSVGEAYTYKGINLYRCLDVEDIKIFYW